MATVEGVALWFGGFEYKPRSSFEKVWASDISFDSEGHTAAALLNYMYTGEKGRLSDIALIDLHRQTTKKAELANLEPRCVAMHPGGDAFVVASSDGKIYAVSDFTKARFLQQEFARFGARQVLNLRFSPNGKLLAAIGDHDVRIWSWPQGQILQQFRYSAAVPSGSRYQPGSNGILLFSSDSRFIVTPSETAGLCLRPIDAPHQPEKIVLADNAFFDAVLAYESELAVIVRASGVSVHRFGSDSATWHQWSTSTSVAMDRQEERLAIAGDNQTGTIEIRHVGTGEKVSTLKGDMGIVAGLQFAGATLYSWDRSGQLHAWDIGRSKLNWSLSLSNG